MKKADLINAVRGSEARSAWKRGVKEYAWMLLDNIERNEILVESSTELKKLLLNGARDAWEYSYGGCALIYDFDIALLLCTPSELIRNKGGERNPNRNESWLDVQGRAIYQALNLVSREWRKLK